jgi:hypothetical protein
MINTVSELYKAIPLCDNINVYIYIFTSDTTVIKYTNGSATKVPQTINFVALLFVYFIIVVSDMNIYSFTVS